MVFPEVTSTYKIKTQFPGRTVVLSEVEQSKSSDSLSGLHLAMADGGRSATDSQRLIGAPHDATVFACCMPTRFST